MAIPPPTTLPAPAPGPLAVWARAQIVAAVSPGSIYNVLQMLRLALGLPATGGRAKGRDEWGYVYYALLLLLLLLLLLSHYTPVAFYKRLGCRYPPL